MRINYEEMPLKNITTPDKICSQIQATGDCKKLHSRTQTMKSESESSHSQWAFRFTSLMVLFSSR